MSLLLEGELGVVPEAALVEQVSICREVKLQLLLMFFVSDELAAMRRPGEAPPGVDVPMPTGRGRGVSQETPGPATAQPTAVPIAQTGGNVNVQKVYFVI